MALHQVAPGAEGLADFENGLLLSPSMYFTYSEHNQTFQSLGVWITGTANVTGMAEPEQVRTVSVTDGVLQTLGVPPAVGRWFSPVDQVPNGSGRVILSYGYWQRRFGGDRQVIGRNITVDSQSREIVGVMPKGFRFVDSDFDLTTPLAFNRGKVILAGFGFHGIARLKPGATIAEANADLNRLLPDLDGFLVERPGLEPTYLRRVENYSDDSPVETASCRQRGRTLVGGHGDDWAGNAHCLRECHESTAGKGRELASRNWRCAPHSAQVGHELFEEF